MSHLTTATAPQLNPLSPAGIEQALKALPGYEKASQQVATALHNAVLNGGKPTRALADLLHGSWLGHPLHPILTDVPIGAWAMAALFDAYAALSNTEYAEFAADTLVGVGVAAAVPTALSGMADYSAMKDDATAVGLTHALLNSAGLSLFLVSLWQRRAGERQRGVLLSTLGLALVGAAAAFGGDLIYRLRVGVNHATTATDPEA